MLRLGHPFLLKVECKNYLHRKMRNLGFQIFGCVIQTPRYLL